MISLALLVMQPGLACNVGFRTGPARVVGQNHVMLVPAGLAIGPSRHGRGDQGLGVGLHQPASLLATSEPEQHFRRGRRASVCRGRPSERRYRRLSPNALIRAGRVESGAGRLLGDVSLAPLSREGREVVDAATLLPSSPPTERGNARQRCYLATVRK